PSLKLDHNGTNKGVLYYWTSIRISVDNWCIRNRRLEGRSMKSLLLSVSLLALIAFGAVAQTPPPPTAAPLGQTAEEKAKLQAQLQGQILNQVTGEPVRKANVSLKPESGG